MQGVLASGVPRGAACGGPYDPAAGHGFNPCKVVIDTIRCSATRSAPDADLSFDERDNAAFAPLAAVIDPAFTWGDDRHPRTPWHKTVIDEMHVKARCS